MDRREIARCIAKVLAYLSCGKTAEARQWFVALNSELYNAGLYDDHDGPCPCCGNQ